MICERCFRNNGSMNELREIQCYDKFKKEYCSVFECIICSWILPDPKEFPT